MAHRSALAVAPAAVSLVAQALARWALRPGRPAWAASGRSITFPNTDRLTGDAAGLDLTTATLR